MREVRNLALIVVCFISQISWASTENQLGECGANRFNAENQPGSGYELLKAFESNFRAAVRAGDFEMLARLVEFPFYLSKDRRREELGRDDFKNELNFILPEFRKILDSDKYNVNCNIQTVWIGNLKNSVIVKFVETKSQRSFRVSGLS